MRVFPRRAASLAASGLLSIGLSLLGTGCGGEDRPDAVADAGGGAIDAPVTDAPVTDAPRNDAHTTMDAKLAAAGTGFPCPIEDVIRRKCLTCHGEVRQFGAPISFPSWSDTQKATEQDDGPVFQRMRQYVAVDFMPLAGSPTGPLSAEEKALLLGWLDAGAPRSDDVCVDAQGG